MSRSCTEAEFVEAVESLDAAGVAGEGVTGCSTDLLRIQSLIKLWYSGVEYWVENSNICVSAALSSTRRVEWRGGAAVGMVKSEAASDPASQRDVDGLDLFPVGEGPVADDEGVGVPDASEKIEDSGVENSFLNHVAKWLGRVV